MCCFPPPYNIVIFTGDESSTKIWDWEWGSLRECSRDTRSDVIDSNSQG